MVGFKAWAAVRRVGARSGSVLLLGVVCSGGCAGKSTGDGDAPDPCPAVCESAAKCPGVPPLQESCADYCLGEDFFAEATGCHALYAQSLACTKKLENVCTALTDCNAQITAAHNCEAAYCSGHPGADICVGFV